MSPTQSTGQRPDWKASTVEFRRGWIGCTDRVQHDVVAEWAWTRIGPLEVCVHPALGWAKAETGEVQVLFLGDVADLESETTDSRRLSTEIATLLATEGSEAVVRRVAYFGGRFTCMLWDGQTLSVLPDCIASLPVYWWQDGHTMVLSSYSHLIGEIVPAALNQHAKDLMAQAKTMKTRGVVYWPGIETPFEGVLPLLPNHALVWRQGTVEHQRFYPFADTSLARDSDTAYAAFAESFATHVRLLCGLGRTGISLTSGMDSRATFAAAQEHMGPDSLAWTFYNFNKPDADIQVDLLTANALARQAGVPHQVVAVETSQDHVFAGAYTRTFEHTAQYRTLSHSYHDQIPHDIVELQSMVAEVGTGFFKVREGTPTPQRLGRLYSNSEFGDLPQVVAAMERFIEYADFTADRVGELDFHDLFYWEQRIGRWGTLRMQEVDMSHRLVLPFNARRIVEALQSPPLDDRVEKQALRRFVTERSEVVRG